jgi:hypothetical protein
MGSSIAIFAVSAGLVFAGAACTGARQEEASSAQGPSGIQRKGGTLPSADGGTLVFSRPAKPGAKQPSLCEACLPNRTACDGASRSPCSAPPPHCHWSDGTAMTATEASEMDTTCKSCLACPK